MTIAHSLFDEPAGAVLPTASSWVTDMLLHEVAIALCILAVAFVGFMLMTGRIVIRKGVRVAIGCFVLLGAPVIAAGLRGAAEDAIPDRPPQPLTIEATSLPIPLPPANYDPYSGASMRRD